VSVIVQKAVKDNSVEALVLRLGGLFCKTCTSLMPGRTIAGPGGGRVSQAPTVRWVSLDAPMLAAACKPAVCTKTTIKTTPKSMPNVVTRDWERVSDGH